MEDFQEITTEELLAWLDEERDFVLVDVLPSDSYETRHIPGAVNVPFEADFEEEVAQVAGKDDLVVVYCASEQCNLSPKAAETLVSAGYENVYDYTAGLAGWKDAGKAFEGAVATA